MSGVAEPSRQRTPEEFAAMLRRACATMLRPEHPETRRRRAEWQSAQHRAFVRAWTADDR